MRVTKTVKEYIQKEVAARMEKRYADEAAEAKRQYDLKESINKAALAAAATAYEQYVRQAIEANDAESFLGFSTYGNEVELRPGYHSKELVLSDENCSSSVHSWRQRMREEIAKKCDEIIVTLELGGTKAELLEMLSQI